MPDRQGRVTVPPHLRDYAGLRRECAVIGASTRVEVWDATVRERCPAAREDAFSALSQEVPPGLQ